MNKSVMLIVLGIIAVPANVGLNGQEPPGDTSLILRVGKLEVAVKSLEARISAIESGPLRNQAVPADKLNWRKLRQGMVADEVRSLLGEPTDVDSGPLLTYWYYLGSHEPRPYVMFESGTLTVNGWREPK